MLRNPAHVDNILLVAGDSIVIPAYSPVVTVRGAVYSPGISVAYVEGADVNYYIRAAGGGNVKGDEGRAYVMQPNGKVETKRRTAFFISSNPDPQAGSTVFVPEKNANEALDWITRSQTMVSFLASLGTLIVLVKSLK